MEMYKCKEERLRLFWHNLQDFWIKLYGSNKTYIAAINVSVFTKLSLIAGTSLAQALFEFKGHALALGCLIAMACDYRIMVNSERNKIGLTAVHLVQLTFLP